MTLQRQMAALGGLLLALPVTTVLLFMHLERTWQQAAEQSLREQARQVAFALRGPFMALGGGRERDDASATSSPAFLPLHDDQPIVLDGYEDDWRQTLLSNEVVAVPDRDDHPPAVHWPGAGPYSSARLRALFDGRDLLLFLQWPNPTWETLTPGRNGAFHDQLKLYSDAPPGEVGPTLPRVMSVAAQAAGLTTNSDGGRALAESHWSHEGGLQTVELRLPGARDLDSLAVCIVEGDAGGGQREHCLLGTPARPLPLLLLPPDSRQILTAISPADSRLVLADPEGRAFLLHDNDPGQDLEEDWSLAQLLIGRLTSFLVPTPSPSAPATVTTSSQAIVPANLTTAQRIPGIQGVDGVIHWRQREDIRRTTFSLTTPVTDSEGSVLGQLTIERRLAGLLRQSTRALANGLALTMLLMLTIVAILLGYGFWLSRRIRRLRDEVGVCLEPGTRYQRTLQPSQRADEMGELSRTFARLLDELRAYASYKETFVAKLTHECRTPVSIIGSSLQLAASSSDEAERQAYLQRAEQGCARLNQLIKAMGESARLEELLSQFEAETFDLSVLLAGAAENYPAILPGHRFSAAIPSTPQPVSGSPDLLLQALDKLIENARDFTPAGGSIHLALHADRGQLRITLENEGAPLPAGHSGQWFAAYHSHRPAPISSAANGGERQLHLGLGLTLVDLIMRFHHGGAAIDSTTHGVCVTLTLPRPTSGHRGSASPAPALTRRKSPRYFNCFPFLVFFWKSPATLAILLKVI